MMQILSEAPIAANAPPFGGRLPHFGSISLIAMSPKSPSFTDFSCSTVITFMHSKTTSPFSSFSASTPIVIVNPITLTENVGATVVFTCNVQGDGPFNVVWTRMDAQQLPGRAQVGPRYSLTIRDIIESDNGRYVCTAINVHGSTRKVVTLTVVGKN